MLGIVLVLGFVATFMYILLSNSKRSKKYTIMISVLMVVSTLLLGVASDELVRIIDEKRTESGNGTNISTEVTTDTDKSTDISHDTENKKKEDSSNELEVKEGNSSNEKTNDNHTEIKAYEKNGKWGYVDNGGNTVIPFIYDYAEDFSEGLAAVRVDYEWGFIDEQGNVVIPFQYSGAWDFVNGLAPVYKDNLWGFINKDNELIIEYRYTNITQSGNAYYDENDIQIIY